MLFPYSPASLEQMLTESPLACAIYGLMLFANVAIILSALLLPARRPPQEEKPTLGGGTAFYIRLARRIKHRPPIASTLSR